jgi:hypothetical protein
MFTKACELARDFTRPVIISSRRFDGKCQSAIGACVVLNREGWAVTAFHIVKEVADLRDAVESSRAYQQQLAAIDGDASLGAKQKKRKAAALGKVRPDAVTRMSAWWGWDGANAVEATVYQPADVAIVRLEPFDPTWIPRYPVFKSPAHPFEQGTSLCRLGYPFHSITPTFDEPAGAFRLPPGSVPPPIFPIEGILTRIVEVNVQNRPEFPVQYIETSSPGFKGQSGGPVVDRQGIVYGIQSQTSHFPLGFSPKAPSGQTEHQFLNVGWAAHAATIVGVCQDAGVNIEVST